jgi:hypothetical protein
MRCRILISAIVAACCMASEPTRAQAVESFEIGAQFTAMRLSGIDTTDAGIGARASWNVNDTLTLEAVSDFFPTGKDNVVRGGRKLDALFGLKEGWRVTRGGAFVKARAGIARVGEGRGVGVCILIFPPPEACYAGETRLAFDLGGVFEIYASRRTTVRIDVGDLATRLTSSSSRFGRRGDFAHDFQVGAGVGVRF